MEQIRIKDTGYDKIGGTMAYIPVNSGAWTVLKGFQFRGEFTVVSTNNVATRTNTVNTSLMDFKSNEISALQTPRFTLQGLVDATDSTLIQNIILFGRSKGIKSIAGGAGLISALPEKLTDTYDYISVIIKNISISEVVRDGTDQLGFTIQLEQVN